MKKVRLGKKTKKTGSAKEKMRRCKNKIRKKNSEQIKRKRFMIPSGHKYR